MITMPMPTGLHKTAERGISLINTCILNFLIEKEGDTTTKEVEEYTGLNNISLQLVADLLKLMAKNKVLVIYTNGSIIANIETIKEIKEQSKTLLPNKHGKPWSEDDYVRLCTLKLEDVSDAEIGIKMNRTQKSVAMQATMIRKAYRLIPMIKRNPVIQEFAERFVSPNSKV